nr:unnamed protein product [Callosobruchus analis]
MVVLNLCKKYTNGYRIKWVNNKANHDDMKLDKPVLLSTAPPEEEEIHICRSKSKNDAREQRTEPEPELEPKWIPFHNEISLSRKSFICEWKGFKNKTMWNEVIHLIFLTYRVAIEALFTPHKAGLPSTISALKCLSRIAES